MDSDLVKFFVDGVAVDGSRGEAVIDAIGRWDGGVEAQLRGGERALTDSRGLVTGLETPVHGGAIFRVVSGRQLQADDAS
jgi:hypothetical protein